MLTKNMSNPGRERGEGGLDPSQEGQARRPLLLSRQFCTQAADKPPAALFGISRSRKTSRHIVPEGRMGRDSREGGHHVSDSSDQPLRTASQLSVRFDERGRHVIVR